MATSPASDGVVIINLMQTARLEIISTGVSRGEAMPETSIAIKAIIAILVVYISWRSGRKRHEKWLITTVATLWVASAVLDIVQERRTAARQTEISAAQNQMADALNILKTNSEDDKRNREKDAQHRLEIRGQLVSFMKEGNKVRAECQNPQSHAEQVWTKKVEIYLRSTSVADETAFNVSETPLICYQSMSIKLAALQKITDEYN
jgi:hypothetical protein